MQSPRSTSPAASASSSIRPRSISSMLRRLNPIGKSSRRSSISSETRRPSGSMGSAVLSCASVPGQASTADVLPDLNIGLIQAPRPTSEASSVMSCANSASHWKARSIGDLPMMSWKGRATAPCSTTSASSSRASVSGTRGIGLGRSPPRSDVASQCFRKAGDTAGPASSRDVPIRPPAHAQRGNQRRPMLTRSPLAAAYAEATNASIAARVAAYGPVRFADDIIEQSDETSSKDDQLCVEDVTS